MQKKSFIVFLFVGIAALALLGAGCEKSLTTVNQEERRSAPDANVPSAPVVVPATETGAENEMEADTKEASNTDSSGSAMPSSADVPAAMETPEQKSGSVPQLSGSGATEGTAQGEPAGQMQPSVKSFTLTAKNFSFSPVEMRVKKGDTVKLTLVNEQGFHDWVVDEFAAKTPQIGEGKTASIEFVATKAGTFEYYCSVGSHRTMGMKGRLIVE